MVGDHESDEVLEFLHNCSQQLLEANIDSTEESNAITIDSRDQSSELSQLESIQDLIQFRHLIDTTNELKSEENTDNQLEWKALSPISCDSDSGYESANSPQNTFHNPFGDPIDDPINDIHWKQTLSELFADLI